MGCFESLSDRFACGTPFLETNGCWVDEVCGGVAEWRNDGMTECTDSMGAVIQIPFVFCDLFFSFVYQPISPSLLSAESGPIHLFYVVYYIRTNLAAASSLHTPRTKGA